MQSGSTVLITGAARGVGRELVAQCLAGGARVVAFDSDEGALRALPDALELTCVAGDVSDADHVARAVAAADQRVDVLFSNAGVMDGLGRADETSVEDFDRLLAVNLRGAFLVARAVLPGMVERGEGLIVTSASIAGLRGGRAGAAYTASKYGLVGLTLNLAATYAADGIRANAVCPGPIATDMTAGIDVAPSAVARRLRDAADRPEALPAEAVAAVAMFFTTTAARHLNGVVLPVDGGWTAF
ncbi:SDR family NAD(P)-dependent oxidoreductase [Conexibacter sp. CPCC 206217]|uniref:SDR family NAD(P)-dependent oxidoreductase n=1 Tax=Conexibacter sp. CPCC 206217 TaxID=3064574 RepID=UPI0027266FFB|nr:SDR family oxidoreductase [Conexibacter sp. CPCC 206217]MDO8210125.1 SDR family oxidoreductase [Conexibacter sp. CPCC 206217]